MILTLAFRLWFRPRTVFVANSRIIDSNNIKTWFTAEHNFASEGWFTARVTIYSIVSVFDWLWFRTSHFSTNRLFARPLTVSQTSSIMRTFQFIAINTGILYAMTLILYVGIGRNFWLTAFVEIFNVLKVLEYLFEKSLRTWERIRRFF